MARVSQAAWFGGVGVETVPHRAEVAADPLGLRHFTPQPRADLGVHPLQPEVHVLGKDSAVREQGLARG